MATDIFMKIDGIEGASQDRTHQGEIDVLWWAWAAANTGPSSRPGGGAGQVDVEDLEFVHAIDKATPQLVEAVCKGVHIPEATLTARSSGQAKPFEYLTITMTDVMVTSVRPTGSTDDDQPTEAVSLGFRELRFAYTPRDTAGAALPPITAECGAKG